MENHEPDTAALDAETRGTWIVEIPSRGPAFIYNAESACRLAANNRTEDGPIQQSLHILIEAIKNHSTFVPDTDTTPTPADKLAITLPLVKWVYILGWIEAHRTDFESNALTEIFAAMTREINGKHGIGNLDS